MCLVSHRRTGPEQSLVHLGGVEGGSKAAWVRGVPPLGVPADCSCKLFVWGLNSQSLICTPGSIVVRLLGLVSCAQELVALRLEVQHEGISKG